jgi:hypothetical protein
MVVRWRLIGEGMTISDLRELDGESLVIHFGGALGSIDAYTFSNSLIAFADTIRAINATVNPSQNIEIRLEAVGTGSFRALIRQIPKGLKGLFAQAPAALIWGLVGTAIWENYLADRPDVTIIVNTNEVIYEVDGNRTIISRNVYDQMPKVRANPDVQKGLSKTFEVLEKDDAVDNFGITGSLNDKEPLVQIPRQDFNRLSSDTIVPLDDVRRRLQKVRTRAIVLKPWIDASKHKWSFEWNGVPISAYVNDGDFLSRVKAHELRFGNGDALDLQIEYFQDFDENLSVWVNDTNSFTISDVFTYFPKGGEEVQLK